MQNSESSKNIGLPIPVLCTTYHQPFPTDNSVQQPVAFCHDGELHKDENVDRVYTQAKCTVDSIQQTVTIRFGCSAKDEELDEIQLEEDYAFDRGQCMEDAQQTVNTVIECFKKEKPDQFEEGEEHRASAQEQCTEDVHETENISGACIKEEQSDQDHEKVEDSSSSQAQCTKNIENSVGENTLICVPKSELNSLAESGIADLNADMNEELIGVDSHGDSWSGFTRLLPITLKAKKKAEKEAESNNLINNTIKNETITPEITVMRSQVEEEDEVCIIAEYPAKNTQRRSSKSSKKSKTKKVPCKSPIITSKEVIALPRIVLQEKQDILVENLPTTQSAILQAGADISVRSDLKVVKNAKDSQKQIRKKLFNHKSPTTISKEIVVLPQTILQEKNDVVVENLPTTKKAMSQVGASISVRSGAKIVKNAKDRKKQTKTQFVNAIKRNLTLDYDGPKIPIQIFKFFENNPVLDADCLYIYPGSDSFFIVLKSNGRYYICDNCNEYAYNEKIRLKINASFKLNQDMTVIMYNQWDRKDLFLVSAAGIAVEMYTVYRHLCKKIPAPPFLCDTKMLRNRLKKTLRHIDSGKKKIPKKQMFYAESYNCHFCKRIFPKSNRGGYIKHLYSCAEK